MTLTETTGTTTMNGTEQTIVDQTILNNYAARIDLNNMASGDTITLKLYTKANGNLRVEQSFTYTGAQAVPLIFIPYVPTLEFKVTLQQTAGTNRAIGWSWFNL